MNVSPPRTRRGAIVSSSAGYSFGGKIPSLIMAKVFPVAFEQVEEKKPGSPAMEK